MNDHFEKKSKDLHACSKLAKMISTSICLA